MIRILRTAGVMIAAAGILVLVAPASPASAEPVDLTCVGTQTVDYSPGLTLVPTTQDISVTTEYSTCIGTSRPDVTSGTSFVQTQVPGRTCLTPLETDTITVTITWNTGETSTFTATRTVTDLAATILVTYSGTIVDGLFAGDLFAQVIEYPNITSLMCLLNPLTQRTGVTAAEFTSV